MTDESHKNAYTPSVTDQTMLRVQEIVRLLAEGKATREIYVFCADRYGIKPRTADDLIRHARREIRMAWEMERPDLLAQLLTHALDVYARSIEQKNMNAAIGALGLIYKMGRFK